MMGLSRAARVLWWAPALGASLVLSAEAAAADPQDLNDLPFFQSAARELISADWAQTFADPDLQAGPVFLLLLGLVELVAGALSQSPTALWSAAIIVGSTAAVMATAREMLSPRPGWRVAAAATGVVAVVTGLSYEAFVSGHPAQIFVPLLWIHAALAAQRGRSFRAGILLGLSAGFEVWGILGAPVLVLSASSRRALLSGATALGVVAALFLPFALAGDFAMFDYEWYVSERTLVGRLLEDGHDFPWTLRLIQGSVALLAGTGVVLVFRSRRGVVWAAPMAIVSLRLIFDPILFSWYWLGLEVLAILGAAHLLPLLWVRLVAPAPVPKVPRGAT